MEYSVVLIILLCRLTRTESQKQTENLHHTGHRSLFHSLAWIIADKELEYVVELQIFILFSLTWHKNG